MSYLLTEIALEMLGYKFYDINGILGQTNFQQNASPRTTEDAAAEESLQSMLGLATGNSAMDCNADAITENVSIAKHLEQTAPTRLHANEDVRSSGQPRPSAVALAKLVDLEFERVRVQVEQLAQRNKTTPERNATQEEQCDGSGASSASDHLLPYITQEKERLLKEAQTLATFRRFVEGSVLKMNRDIFRKYQRAFNGCQPNKNTESDVSTRHQN